jgi:hypothetical protein
MPFWAAFCLSFEHADRSKKQLIEKILVNAAI